MEAGGVGRRRRGQRHRSGRRSGRGEGSRTRGGVGDRVDNGGAPCASRFVHHAVHVDDWTDEMNLSS